MVRCPNCAKRLDEAIKKYEECLNGEKKPQTYQEWKSEFRNDKASNVVRLLRRRCCQTTVISRRYYEITL